MTHHSRNFPSSEADQQALERVVEEGEVVENQSWNRIGQADCSIELERTTLSEVSLRKGGPDNAQPFLKHAPSSYPVKIEKPFNST